MYVSNIFFVILFLFWCLIVPLQISQIYFVYYKNTSYEHFIYCKYIYNCNHNYFSKKCENHKKMWESQKIWDIYLRTSNTQAEHFGKIWDKYTRKPNTQTRWLLHRTPPRKLILHLVKRWVSSSIYLAETDNSNGRKMTWRNHIMLRKLCYMDLVGRMLSLTITTD